MGRGIVAVLTPRLIVGVPLFLVVSVGTWVVILLLIGGRELVRQPRWIVGPVAVLWALGGLWAVFANAG